MNLKVLLNNLFNFYPGGETAIFFTILLLTFLLGLFSFVIIYHRPFKVLARKNESNLNDKLSEAQKSLELVRKDHGILQIKLKEKESEILISQNSKKEYDLLLEQTAQKNQKLELDIKLLNLENNELKTEKALLSNRLAEGEHIFSDLEIQISDLKEQKIQSDKNNRELEDKFLSSEIKAIKLLESLEEANNNLSDAIQQIEKLNREVEILNSVIQSTDNITEEKKKFESLVVNNNKAEKIIQSQFNTDKRGTDLKKLSAMTREIEADFNAGGIFFLEQLAACTETELIALFEQLNGRISFSKFESWVSEAKKVLTKQKIILLTKDINLKKLFKKR